MAQDPSAGPSAAANKGLEPTAPMAVLWPAGVVEGAAAQAWRSASSDKECSVPRSTQVHQVREGNRHAAQAHQT